MVNKFGEKVEELLKENNYTKYKLAKDTGISKSVLSDYCKGKVQPTADTIIMIAKYFDVTTDFLLGLEDEAGRKEYSDEFSYSDGTHKITHKRRK